jgi:RNA polymerase sigma-70 factor (ECF subfamily)
MLKLKEKQLLYLIKVNKDADAFASLYDIYVSRVYRFVYFKVSNRQEAEDIVADLFLKAWKYLTSDDTKEVGSFSGLIYDMARNATVDWYRKNAQSHVCALDDIVHLSDGSDIAQSAADSFDSQALLKQIKTMKHEYQEVLILKYVEDLSMSEIATLLGRSQVSVRVTLHRATKKLKELSEKKKV